MRSELDALLSQQLLDLLAKRGSLRSYSRRETIVVEGEPSDSYYLLMSGGLKVYTRDDKGRELVYNMLRPGECFGEMVLDGGPRSATVAAMVDSKCIVIDHDKVRAFMKQYPEFAECLAMKLIERLRHATQQTRSLVLNDIYERTVLLLNKMAENHDGARIVPAWLTQQEIANRIGATREMVNRVLRDLVKGEYLIKGEGRRRIIAQPLPERWERSSNGPFA